MAELAAMQLGKKTITCRCLSNVNVFCIAVNLHV